MWVNVDLGLRSLLERTLGFEDWNGFAIRNHTRRHKKLASFNELTFTQEKKIGP